MLSDPYRVFLAQGPQLVLDRPIQLEAGHVVVDCRLRQPRLPRGQHRATALAFPIRPASGTAIGAPLRPLLSPALTSALTCAVAAALTCARTSTRSTTTPHTPTTTVVRAAGTLIIRHWAWLHSSVV